MAPRLTTERVTYPSRRKHENETDASRVFASKKRPRTTSDSRRWSARDDRWSGVTPGARERRASCSSASHEKSFARFLARRKTVFGRGRSAAAGEAGRETTAPGSGSDSGRSSASSHVPRSEPHAVVTAARTAARWRAACGVGEGGR